jgi:hypothetical protein
MLGILGTLDAVPELVEGRTLGIFSMKLRGRVAKRVLYRGTKSEHEGLVLQAPEGEFKLRRHGGNPFQDETLGGLEGEEIEGEGILRKGQFIMFSWRTLE